MKVTDSFEKSTLRKNVKDEWVMWFSCFRFPATVEMIEEKRNTHLTFLALFV